VYTVKQLSELADVSIRTLHYYDEIALLRPSKVGANGYRYYDDASLMRLQQILFYREIGLELLQIKDVLDQPDFDLVQALRAHRSVLEEKAERMQQLIETVDSTIRHLAGETTMAKKQLFKGFTPEEQKQYEREARLQYGPDTVNASIKLWNSYSKEKQEAIMAEAGEIYTDFAEAMVSGKPATSSDVQDIVARWHQNMRYFYEPSYDVMRGLANGYNTDPAFMKTFQQFHPDLTPYLEESITFYVDELETAEISRMLAEDEVGRMEG
jgi:MerR family transcriptional regulator, thiopeptide resistance regulator